MKKANEQLEILSTARGVESSLVVVGDKEFNTVYVSIQKNKSLTEKSKIALVSKNEEFSKFIKRIEKEIKSPSAPDNTPFATLTCDSFCEILRIYKIEYGYYEAIMYYSYRRPRNKNYADSVSLSTADLEKFLQGLGVDV